MGPFQLSFPTLAQTSSCATDHVYTNSILWPSWTSLLWKFHSGSEGAFFPENLPGLGAEETPDWRDHSLRGPAPDIGAKGRTSWGSSMEGPCQGFAFRGVESATPNNKRTRSPYVRDDVTFDYDTPTFLYPTVLLWGARANVISDITMNLIMPGCRECFHCSKSLFVAIDFVF